MKKIGTTIAFLLLLALPVAQAPACAAARQAEETRSNDLELSSGDWTSLTRRHPSLYVSGDIADAPPIEKLSKWWEALGDETLTRLIMASFANNRDLAAARAKVAEARATLGIGKAAVLPWLDSVNYWTQKKTPKDAGGTGKALDIYRLGLDASWEIDIFGGKRAAIKAGVASLEAEHAALHAAWVTLSSEIAIDYISLRTLQERLRIAEKNLALQTETFELLQSKYDAGLINALALNQSRYTVERTKAMIPTLRTHIEKLANALAILIGEVPGSLEALLDEKAPLVKPDLSALVGIPAATLRQRPDIRAAERRLAAQIARKKSAQADLLPKFHLLGSIGLESLNTGSLFSSGGFSFGPRITWPIFHGSAIRNNIRVQGARQEQALSAYEGTVLAAVAEVRDALTAETQERLRNESLKSGMEAAKTAFAIADDKYKNGLSDFKNVIDAQSALLSFEEEFAVSEGQMLSNMVRLFKALGGGWAPLAEAEEPPKSEEK